MTMPIPGRFLFALLATLPALSSLSLCAADSKPKVRAITGFVTIDAKSYVTQLTETAKFLSQMRDGIRAAGYEVAGIRIATQPFPEYTKGMSRADALKMLRDISDLSLKLGFNPNIGPAMRKDTDSTEPVELLIDVLSTPGNRLTANLVCCIDPEQIVCD